MTVRTYVSTTVRNDRLDEVLHALENVDPNAIVASVTRSDAPDALAGASLTLAGDVREAVKEQLDVFPDLDCEIEVRE
ncbi:MULTISPECIES: hypothetical protein [unclassified Streptomyces]|uniref:hypothetical protein n=1 Tax=unclassified Streptomyces TaxID=2593676 RepID=UPI002251CE50|nr:MULTISPECIES: hypothetical protein [unclassified Streptomyces]MCX4882250.1 hypothetical protein [Streptomyces sp. NBC_00847]MCX5422295.1 hypothetical protein [Streptomyces sp. NBC_00078]